MQIAIRQKKKKKLSMFPVVHPKTAMRYAFFFKFSILLIEKQQWTIFFIDRTARYTHPNNNILLQVTQKQTQIKQYCFL